MERPGMQEVSHFSERSERVIATIIGGWRVASASRVGEFSRTGVGQRRESFRERLQRKAVGARRQESRRQTLLLLRFSRCHRPIFAENRSPKRQRGGNAESPSLARLEVALFARQMFAIPPESS
jgi:hypothetical protein